MVSSSRLGAERTSKFAGHGGQWGDSQVIREHSRSKNGVSDWLRTEARRIAEEVDREGSSEDNAVEIDYWLIGIDHPFGRWMGELR